MPAARRHNCSAETTLNGHRTSSDARAAVASNAHLLIKASFHAVHVHGAPYALRVVRPLAAAPAAAGVRRDCRAAGGHRILAAAAAIRPAGRHHRQRTGRRRRAGGRRAPAPSAAPAPTSGGRARRAAAAAAPRAAPAAPRAAPAAPPAAAGSHRAPLAEGISCHPTPPHICLRLGQRSGWHPPRICRCRAVVAAAPHSCGRRAAAAAPCRRPNPAAGTAAPHAAAAPVHTLRRGRCGQCC